MDQMKLYMVSTAKHLLTAGLRVIDICYEIQNMLQINYPEKGMATGCPFASANSGAFMYSLMMHYVTADLDAPIFSTREVASTFHMTVQILQNAFSPQFGCSRVWLLRNSSPPELVVG